MLTKFRQLKFGYTPIDFRQQQTDAAEQILISYIRSAAKFDMLTNVPATLEVFGLAKQYIGPSFREWMIFNFGGGAGMRAAFVRRIHAWIVGTTSARTVTNAVRLDLNRLQFLSDEGQLKLPTVFPAIDPTAPTTLNFNLVEDRHFFEMIAVLGPELTARFLLSLNGIRTT